VAFIRRSLLAWLGRRGRLLLDLNLVHFLFLSPRAPCGQTKRLLRKKKIKNTIKKKKKRLPRPQKNEWPVRIRFGPAIVFLTNNPQD